MIRCRTHPGPRNENGSRVSGVEVRVVRLLEQEEHAKKFCAAVEGMVQKSGFNWVVLQLAATARVHPRFVSSMLRKYGVRELVEDEGGL